MTVGIGLGIPLLGLKSVGSMGKTWLCVSSGQRPAARSEFEQVKRLLAKTCHAFLSLDGPPKKHGKQFGTCAPRQPHPAPAAQCDSRLPRRPSLTSLGYNAGVPNPPVKKPSRSRPSSCSSRPTSWPGHSSLTPMFESPAADEKSGTVSVGWAREPDGLAVVLKWLRGHIRAERSVQRPTRRADSGGGAPEQWCCQRCAPRTGLLRYFCAVVDGFRVAAGVSLEGAPQTVLYCVVLGDFTLDRNRCHFLPWLVFQTLSWGILLRRRSRRGNWG